MLCFLAAIVAAVQNFTLDGHNKFWPCVVVSSFPLFTIRLVRLCVSVCVLYRFRIFWLRFLGERDKCHLATDRIRTPNNTDTILFCCCSRSELAARRCRTSDANAHAMPKPSLHLLGVCLLVQNINGAPDSVRSVCFIDDSFNGFRVYMRTTAVIPFGCVNACCRIGGSLRCGEIDLCGQAAFLTFCVSPQCLTCRLFTYVAVSIIYNLSGQRKWNNDKITFAGLKTDYCFYSVIDMHFNKLILSNSLEFIGVVISPNEYSKSNSFCGSSQSLQYTNRRVATLGHLVKRIFLLVFGPQTPIRYKLHAIPRWESSLYIERAMFATADCHTFAPDFVRSDPIPQCNCISLLLVRLEVSMIQCISRSVNVQIFFRSEVFHIDALVQLIWMNNRSLEGAWNSIAGHIYSWANTNMQFAVVRVLVMRSVTWVILNRQRYFFVAVFVELLHRWFCVVSHRKYEFIFITRFQRIHKFRLIFGHFSFNAIRTIRVECNQSTINYYFVAIEVPANWQVLNFHSNLLS